MVMFMNKYEDILFKLCKKAYKKDEVPVAALIVNSKGKIIAQAYNSREKSFLCIDHAEIKCLIIANKCMKNKFLNDCTMYVTLEPCNMCKSILKESRIKEVNYIIARDIIKKPYDKTNFQNWNCDNQIKEEYSKLLSNFFKKKR